ncbi:MAG TPA: hypothetical protein VLM40_07980 [Gemmata sp.]|nr:hypothetical protein [Gemmata sp.]
MQPAPFGAPAPFVQPQPRYQPRVQPQPPRAVAGQGYPRTQPTYQPRPRPVEEAALPPPDFGEPRASAAPHTIEVPSPESLGIHLDLPRATPAVVVPDPAKLGIKVE